MVPDEYRPVPVLVLGQAPGEHEERGERLVGRAGRLKKWEPGEPAPFIGDSGYDLGRTYLPLAGLVREDVSLANVVRCRVGGSNQLPTLERVEVRNAIQHCQQAYFRPPAACMVVVALGGYALWATTGEDGGDPPPYGISRKIAGWRGWVLPWSPFKRQTASHVWTPPGGGMVVYATLHPAAIYEAPWLKPAALRDWQKLGELLAGRWPQPMPPIRRAMAAWPAEFAFDTEFWEQGQERHLVRWSASDGEKVWVVDADEPLPRMLGTSAQMPHVIFHQADADIDRLEEFFGTVPVTHEDTMYAHHALYSELAHDLDFLGSLYARTNRWKHLSQANPVEYAAGDALGTWDVWQGLRDELARDPASEWVYRHALLPLLRIVAMARRVGIRVDALRAKRAVLSLRDAQHTIALEAQAAAGWPLNLRSGPQVAAQGYGVERWR